MDFKITDPNEPGELRAALMDLLLDRMRRGTEREQSEQNELGRKQGTGS